MNTRNTARNIHAFQNLKIGSQIKIPIIKISFNKTTFTINKFTFS